jgi:hypothetical protein
MGGSLAFRVFMVLTVVAVAVGIALFYLQAFSYVIALALSAVFALGALAAATLENTRASKI